MSGKASGWGGRARVLSREGTLTGWPPPVESKISLVFFKETLGFWSMKDSLVSHFC